MKPLPQSSLNAYICQSLTANASLPALSDLHGECFTYREVARRIARFHIIFQEASLCHGDKIAFCGKNSSRWAMAFLASMTYGATSVPILHEFHTDSIHHLVDHSDARVLFVDEAIWDRLDHSLMPKLKFVVNLRDYSLLYSADVAVAAAAGHIDDLESQRYPHGFSPDMLACHHGDRDGVAVINYTSGSTGFSKGVALTYGNLWSNIQFCIDGLTFLEPGDGTVCMLPLAHMFGLMVELLHPFVKGCHINFITRVPSPRIILDAFATVRPKLIVTVPLVLEKIIRSKVFPALKKPPVSTLLHVPFLNRVIYRKIRRQIVDAFGGRVLEVILGGAAVGKDVEQFLRRIRFPFTVGYGMTECGPLVAYAPWQQARPGGCGRPADRMQVRVESPDPTRIPGALWIKGDNVMLGYYKNPEATAAVMDDDGWMNSGDICTIGADGTIFIRGRDKNLILGPSGQNIYPEEIEQALGNQPLVEECIVVDRNHRLIALIYANPDDVARQGLDRAALEALMRRNIDNANAVLPAYSRISEFELRDSEFEKTPKRSIKRFLYK